MTIKNNNRWAERRALMDCVMLGNYDVSDKVGITEWIESLSDDKVLELSESIVYSVSDNESKNILESGYMSSMAAKSTSHVMSENLLRERAYSIIQEADEGQPMIDVDKLLKHGGGTVVAVAALKAWIIDPEQGEKIMLQLKRISSTEYDKGAEIFNRMAHTWKITQAHRNLSWAEKAIDHSLGAPDPDKIKGAKEALAKLEKDGPTEIFPRIASYVNRMKRVARKITNLNNATAAPGNVSGVNTARKELDREIKKAGIAWDKHNRDGGADALKSKGVAALKSTATKASYLILLVGITGTIIWAYNLYKNMIKGAGAACKKLKKNDHTICVLNYKIRACDQFISELRGALPACEKHKNPDRCNHSIQTHIWNWTRKKKAFQEKLHVMMAVHPNVPITTPGATRATPGAESSIFRNRM